MLGTDPMLLSLRRGCAGCDNLTRTVRRGALQHSDSERRWREVGRAAGICVLWCLLGTIGGNEVSKSGRAKVVHCEL